jgi:hypothetical protein
MHKEADMEPKSDQGQGQGIASGGEGWWLAWTVGIAAVLLFGWVLGSI